MAQIRDRTDTVPLWRDERFWKIALQLLVLVLVVGSLWLLMNNAIGTLARQGRQFNFGFLGNPSSFNIGETIIPYQPQDPYYKAFLVGLVNTLRLILVGFVLTTVLGIVAGIASFSDNWLVRKLNQVYVELVRNTPLLLQLFVWYFAIILSQAGTGQTPNRVLNSIYITKSQGGGIFVPWPANTTTSWISLLLLVAAAIVAAFLVRWQTKVMAEQGASGQPQRLALVVLGVVALLLLTVGMGWRVPALNADGIIEGGLRLSLEYAAALGGLVFYTGAFIAEIVRAGIQSVSKGQWEAAKALGLQPGLVMRLVVFPQALRVIIPSLNSQYMNLAKNSSLALAIGYPDIYSTASTTFNQTGRPLEVFVIIAATYLVINLIISVIMNQLNRSVQLKER